MEYPLNNDPMIDRSTHPIDSRQAREGIAKLSSTGGPVAQRLVQGTHKPFVRLGIIEKTL